MESYFPRYDDVSVVSVGAGDSVVLVDPASVGAVASVAGLIMCAAVTVTEARGAAVEVGNMGVKPWERTGGSWEGSMVGRGGNVARFERFRGGSGARDGTVEDR